MKNKLKVVVIVLAGIGSVAYAFYSQAVAASSLI